MLSINSGSVTSVFHLNGCLPPLDHVAPRREGFAQVYEQELQKEAVGADSKQGYQVIFYGDSITETWKGTDMGRECPRCAGVPDVLDKHFGMYTTGIYAVGGDQVDHLMYRLQHRELLKRHPPKVSVLLIGTNDLGAASCFPGGGAPITRAANATAQRILEMLEYMRANNPKTEIVLLSLLPRGGQTDQTWWDWPNRFSKAIEIINAHQKNFAKTMEGVHYVDCTAPFLPNGKLDENLMPDALHPNAEGMDLFAACFAEDVHHYMGRATSF
ncbi:hypothetical protein WJX84_002342 [Apatococcus fuscideae]|uniref:SGNH hydrolase-type esterase domain-containing protein n=1 Tax=Apatococcus fuscideae TaxID=2026836 RepID=A0AAW1SU24_9CHLO